MVKSTAQFARSNLNTAEFGALTTPFDDLAAVCAEHQARIFRFLLFSLNDSHAAASLTQDTFLTAWRTRASFRGECAPSTWLTRIAVRLMQNHVRGERFRFWSRVERSAVDVGEIAGLLPAAEPNPESALVARQRLAQVFRIVTELPEQQRTAFLLRFNDDLDLPEIATAMNLSLSAAKTHLYRALERVRRECGRPENDPKESQ
jgi:RNA polymerase sigma-70 factor, ECF subfamily